MLFKMKGSEIEPLWDMLYEAVYNLLPKHEQEVPNLKNNLFKALTEEKMQLWLLYNSSKVVKSFMITFITINSFTGLRELFIYAFYSFEQLTEAEYSQGLMVINEFARVSLCHCISAYTNIPKLVEFVNKNNGTTVNKISIPVIGG